MIARPPSLRRLDPFEPPSSSVSTNASITRTEADSNPWSPLRVRRVRDHPCPLSRIRFAPPGSLSLWRSTSQSNAEVPLFAQPVLSLFASADQFAADAWRAGVT